MSEQQTNLLLVGEVEKRPVLYNFHLPGYSKRHETEKAWEEVGNIVKLSAAECKERWKNIRAVFVRHMKPPKSGSGTKDKKAYYLSEALQFTVPYIKALGTPSGNLPQPPQPQGEEEQAEEDYEPQSDTHSPSPSSLPPPKSLPCSSTSTAESSQLRDHQSEPVKQITKKKRVAKNDDVDKAFLEYLGRKNATSTAQNERPTDPRTQGIKMFLLSLLPDIVKMDDGGVRKFKRKALDAVDEILSARSPHPLSTSSGYSNSLSSHDMRHSPTGELDYCPSNIEQPNISFSPLADYYSSAFQQDYQNNAK